MNYKSKITVFAIFVMKGNQEGYISFYITVVDNTLMNFSKRNCKLENITSIYILITLKYLGTNLYYLKRFSKFIFQNYYLEKWPN